MNYTRVKVDGTVAMYWFIHVLINLPIGDCAMYFDHDVPAWFWKTSQVCCDRTTCPILISVSQSHLTEQGLGKHARRGEHHRGDGTTWIYTLSFAKMLGKLQFP